MLLLINTGDDNRIIIGLSDGQKILDKKSVQSKFKHIEKLLPLIQSILKQNKIKLLDLTGIIVAKGSGGFSSVRIGVATANTLALVLGLPLAGVRIAEDGEDSLQELLMVGIKMLRKNKGVNVIVPEYDHEPRITASER